MKVLRSSLIALSLFLGAYAGGAQALILFNFQVGFAAGGGPLGGTTANGLIGVPDADCPAAVCSGTFTPAGPANSGGPTNTLAYLLLNIDGTPFQLTSDSGYPDFPSFTLLNNLITGIDLIADAGLPGLTLSFSGTPLAGAGIYANAAGTTSFIDQVTQINGAVQVPEPGTAMLLGAGLLAALGFARRRQREQAA